MKNPGAIARLIAEIDFYLARFDGPGIRDVRKGIARFSHQAPELYVPLTGPHEWRFGSGESWTECNSHTIWRQAFERQYLRAGDVDHRRHPQIAQR